MEPIQSKNKIAILTVGSIVVAVAVFLIGFWIGNENGKQAGTSATEAKYQPIVNAAFPEPPAVLTQVRTKITSIQGNNLTISMDDPSDYLPHLDNSPKKQVAKTVVIDQNTKIVKLDYSKMNKSGMPLQSSLSVSDLKSGDVVVITTDSNIRTSGSFVAKQITLSVY